MGTTDDKNTQLSLKPTVYILTYSTNHWFYMWPTSFPINQSECAAALPCSNTCTERKKKRKKEKKNTICVTPHVKQIHVILSHRKHSRSQPASQPAPQAFFSLGRIQPSRRQLADGINTFSARPICNCDNLSNIETQPSLSKAARVFSVSHSH